MNNIKDRCKYSIVLTVFWGIICFSLYKYSNLNPFSLLKEVQISLLLLEYLFAISVMLIIIYFNKVKINNFFVQLSYLILICIILLICPAVIYVLGLYNITENTISIVKTLHQISSYFFYSPVIATYSGLLTGIIIGKKKK